MSRVLRRLFCLLRGGHKWTGYGHQPLSSIICERCGFLP